jgi:hypothetical protein
MRAENERLVQENALLKAKFDELQAKLVVAETVAEHAEIKSRRMSEALGAKPETGENDDACMQEPAKQEQSNMNVH